MAKSSGGGGRAGRGGGRGRLITATVRGSKVFALYPGQTTDMARKAIGKKRVWTDDNRADWDLEPEIVAALKGAGADMSRVQRIGWEF